MILSQIINEVDNIEIVNLRDEAINGVTFDSRQAVEGVIFVALRGSITDGHKYIDSAVTNGCRVIVCEDIPELVSSSVCYIVVKDTTIALAQIASKLYGNPSSGLKLIGVTGTNGKTTIATLLYNLFTFLGYKVGLISTVRYMIGNKELPSTHTTPDVIRLNAIMAEMVEEGCEYCFMEVSSHSIVQNRIYGLDFDGAVFTNITHDHLDYHGTFSDYIKAKKKFFDGLKSSAFALYNSDDRNGAIMVQNCEAEKYTFGLRTIANYKCTVLEQLFEGTLLDINGIEVWSRLIGRFNASNMVAVYAVAQLLGVERNELLQGISTLTTVEGRFDYVISANGVVAVVDYAHTPDALQNILDTINDIKTPQQRLITVVGCGGDRDTSKRPEMALIAVKGSDIAVFTSDNPRSENPEDILSDMEAGVSGNIDFATKYLLITDRRQAIKMAIMSAKPSEIVLVAGKGHETYQEINGVKNHFSDKEEILKIFDKLSNK